MTWWRFTAALAACSLEGLAAAQAFQGAWPLALALHAASSGCAAASIHRRLIDGPAGWSLALVFAGMLLLPALGLLGLAALALSTPPAQESAEPELVRTPVPPPPEPCPGAGWPPDGSAPSRTGRKARLAAVAEARGWNHPMAIARLQRALEDPDEEVRLLAHAVLESKSRTAHRRIHLVVRELEAAPPFRRPALHRQLAMEHWELAWLGLAEGACLDQALEAARRHAQTALDAEPLSASLHFLLGRIALRQGHSRQAESELLRASELGLPATLLAPYLAEAAFFARRFDLVRQGLAGADGGGETVERLRRYWT